MYWVPSTGAEATRRDVFIYSINKVEADADVNKNINYNNAIKVILNYLELFGGCGTRGLYEQLFYNIFN